MRSPTKFKSSFVPGAIALVAFIAAYHPVYVFLSQKWIASDDYSHAFITLPILIYMVWDKRNELYACHARYNAPGITMLLISTCIYLFGIAANVYTIISYSMFFSLVGMTLYLFGVQGVRILTTQLILFLLLIPVTDQLYIKITFPLQIKVSQISEILVRSAGIPIFRDGNVMNTATKSFEVVEACSGLRSIITLATLSLIMGYFFLQRTLTKITLLLASVPTAIFTNVIRVVSLILLYHFAGIDATEGSSHTVLGLIVFLCGFGILFLLQGILIKWETK
jgi:exosortase